MPEITPEIMPDTMHDNIMGDIHSSDDKLLVLPLGDDSGKITQILSNDTARSILNIIVDTPLSASDIAKNLGSPLTTIKYNLDILLDAGFINIHSKRWSRKGREIKLYYPSNRLILFVPNATDRGSVMAMLRRYIGVIGAAVFASAGIEVLLSRTGLQTLRMQEQLVPAVVPVAELAMEKSADMGSGADIDAMIGDYARENATTAIAKMEEEALAGSVSDAISATAPNISAEVSLIQSPGFAQVPSAAAPDIAHMVQPSSGYFDVITQPLAHPGLWFLLGCLFIIALLVMREYIIRKRR